MKYYAIKATFTYYHDNICYDCKCNDITYDDEPGFSITKTIYYPIDDIKDFMDMYDDHINPDMKIKKSFPIYDELEKMAIGKFIDNKEYVCENSDCKNGEYIFGGRARAKITNYDSNCTFMEIIEDKKRQLKE